MVVFWPSTEVWEEAGAFSLSWPSEGSRSRARRQGITSLLFDKLRSRELLSQNNLPVPSSVSLHPELKTDREAVEMLGWPCVLKPRHGALGFGVTRLESLEAIAEASARAHRLDRELLLERAIGGPEVQVVMLGSEVLGSMEVHRRRDAKGGLCEEMQCPPGLPPARLRGIEQLAKRAVEALGIEHELTRVDILCSPRHNEVILEVEALPPLHRDSVVARVMRAHGFPYEALLARLVAELQLQTAPVETDGTRSVYTQ